VILIIQTRFLRKTMKEDKVVELKVKAVEPIQLEFSDDMSPAALIRGKILGDRGLGVEPKRTPRMMMGAQRRGLWLIN
jgi:hypothetical protein